MSLNVERSGAGAPLLLIHGLGGSVDSWAPVRRRLADAREVIAIDLPGHGASPVGPGADSFSGLTDAVEAFLVAHGLEGVDAVGSSMGARLVMELVRRERLGRTVALDPGGFWEGWERGFFATTIGASIRLVRAIQPVIEPIARSAVGRAALLAQLSAHPTRLAPGLVINELKSFAATSTFDALVRDLAHGPGQQGRATPPGQVLIGWGRHDRLCLPRQAERAVARFPGATLHWFDHSGHFPMWDQPAETAALLLDWTS